LGTQSRTKKEEEDILPDGASRRVDESIILLRGAGIGRLGSKNIMAGKGLCKAISDQSIGKKGY